MNYLHMKQKVIHTSIKTVFPFLMVFLFTPCYAQYQEKNEVSFFVGGGYSTLYYYLSNVPGGKLTPGYGGATGLGYTFFFNNTIGIGTGAEIAMYNSKFGIGEFSDKYPSFDGEENFEFRYTVNGYTERQSLFAIQIPLFLQFQFPFPLFSEEHLAYIALGGRIGFPLHSTYRSSADSYTTSAYYPQYDAPLEAPLSQGLGVFNNRTYKDELQISNDNHLSMLSAEIGMKWMISNNYSLYTGIYFDYSIYDIYKNRQTDAFLKYLDNDPVALPNRSILYSSYYSDNFRNAFVGRVFPHALGLKIRLAFRFPNKNNCCF